MSTDLIDYLSVIRKLNEKYSAMIPDKDYWNGRSVGEEEALGNSSLNIERK